MEIKNAKIRSTFLGIESHGIFTCILNLDYGNSAQGFGTHDLKYSKYGIEYLERILDVVGVDSWEELSGCHVRVKAEHTKVFAIGNFLENRWFNPEEDLDK